MNALYMSVKVCMQVHLQATFLRLKYCRYDHTLCPNEQGSRGAVQQKADKCRKGEGEMG